MSSAFDRAVELHRPRGLPINGLSAPIWARLHKIAAAVSAVSFSVLSRKRPLHAPLSQRWMVQPNPPFAELSGTGRSSRRLTGRRHPWLDLAAGRMQPRAQRHCGLHRAGWEQAAQPSERSHGYVAWIVLGLIAGAIAKFLMPGRDPGGIFITIIIGIVGAVIGGFIGNSLGVGDVPVSIWRSIVLSVVGAIVLLIVYRMVTDRRASA